MEKSTTAGQTIDINCHICIEATENTIDFEWAIIDDEDVGAYKKLYAESVAIGDTICSSISYKATNPNVSYYLLDLTGNKNEKAP